MRCCWFVVLKARQQIAEMRQVQREALGPCLRRGDEEQALLRALPLLPALSQKERGRAHREELAIRRSAKRSWFSGKRDNKPKAQCLD
jgi:hypothetical protein